MKKYFLLISLFTLVFLWLGNNYSFGQQSTCDLSLSTCDNDYACESIFCGECGWTRNNSNHQCTDPNVDPNVTQRRTTCNNQNITSSNVSYVNKDVDGNCCSQWWAVPWLNTCDPTKLVENQQGMPCDPPTGWNINSVGFCSCPTWFKNVNDECKPCSDPNVCCGISLNTSIPFIGNCIEDDVANRGPGETSVTWTTAFPVLMWSLTKILVTLILIISFVLIIIWGIMIATGNPSWGKKMIMNVVVGIALLWASWVILRLINPNFFG